MFLLDTTGIYSIKGNVELRDFVGDVTSVPVTIQLKRYGLVSHSETVYLDANGNYEIRNIPSEEVTPFDFGILVRNFGAMGDW